MEHPYLDLGSFESAELQFHFLESNPEFYDEFVQANIEEDLSISEFIEKFAYQRYKEYAEMFIG